MIKKSRDSISSVDSLGSVRSLAMSSNMSPLDESSTTLRRFCSLDTVVCSLIVDIPSFRSTPHLGGIPPPRRSSPYSRVMRSELPATGTVSYRNLAVSPFWSTVAYRLSSGAVMAELKRMGLVHLVEIFELQVRVVVVVCSLILDLSGGQRAPTRSNIWRGGLRPDRNH